MKETMPTDQSDKLILPLEALYNEYLTDESRTSGNAESISFPRSEAQVREIVSALFERQIPITVQGSRTGITGGAVPAVGHIMNLSKMTRVTGMEQDQDGNVSIRVEPGILLSELDCRLENRRFDTADWDIQALNAFRAFREAGRLFWPPDPSESSASVGGIAASNSRGICAHHYGPAGDHIKSIRVVDGKGHGHSIARGEYVVSDGLCPLPGGGTLPLDPTNLDPGSTVDLLDLYLGSQGMLGVITELTLALKPLPSELWGIVFFFNDQSGAVTFVESVNQRPKIQSATSIVAIELMDHTTLESIREFKQVNTRLKDLPDWHHSVTTAVYMEIHGNSAEEIDPLCEWLMETAAESGCDPAATWAACGKMETERLRLFRRGAPEAVNRLIDTARQTDSRITKLGTDMRLTGTSLSELIALYQTDLAASGLKAAIFGHAADGHLHVNILPRDYGEFDRGQRLVENWARRIDALGGSVVTEHGAGKIRKGLFRSMPLPNRLKLIRCLKRQLDPQELWNPGNMPDSLEINKNPDTGNRA